MVPTRVFDGQCQVATGFDGRKKVALGGEREQPPPRMLFLRVLCFLACEAWVHHRLLPRGAARTRVAAMKTILASQTMDLPSGVKIEIKAKQIRVTGPRGVLTRNFKHLNLDFQMIEEGRKLQVDAWFGTRKTMAAIRTAISHINNLITGVTKGYRYKMRFVYAHFPINASIGNDKDNIEIRNFLGEKKVRCHADVLQWKFLMCNRRF